MEDQDIKKLRAEVIDKFINLETVMDAVITQHYFHQTHKQFMEEVLYDDSFSFHLKHNILLKITHQPANKVLKKLHEIGKIRNIFAHRGRVKVDWVGNSKRERVMDSKNLEKEIDFQEIL